MESYERGVQVINGVVAGSKDFPTVTLTWSPARRAGKGMGEVRPGKLQPALVNRDE
jgi:hypothetical protein